MTTLDSWGVVRTWIFARCSSYEERGRVNAISVSRYLAVAPFPTFLTGACKRPFDQEAEPELGRPNFPVRSGNMGKSISIMPEESDM